MARRLLSWTSCGTTSQSIVSSKEEREPFIEPNTLNAALNPTTRHDQRKIIGACCMVTNGKCEGKENDITNWRLYLTLGTGHLESMEVSLFRSRASQGSPAVDSLYDLLLRTLRARKVENWDYVPGASTSAHRSQRTFSSAAPAASCNECTQPVRILRCGFLFTCQPCDATSCGSGSWERWNDGSWSYWNEEFRETEWYASPLVNSVKTGDSHPGLSTHAQCIIFVSLTGKGRIHLLSTLQNW